MLTVIEQPSGAAATAKYPHDHHHLTRHNEYALSSVKIIGTGQPQHWPAPSGESGDGCPWPVKSQRRGHLMDAVLLVVD